MNPTKTWMPAIIAFVLLVMFGCNLFAPVLFPNVTFDQTLVQTLINLTIAAVMYHIGTTQGSAKKDETIASQLGNKNEPGIKPSVGP